MDVGITQEGYLQWDHSAMQLQQLQQGLAASGAVPIEK
jgi:hypothetical protein